MRTTHTGSDFGNGVLSGLLMASVAFGVARVVAWLSGFQSLASAVEAFNLWMTTPQLSPLDVLTAVVPVVLLVVIAIAVNRMMVMLGSGIR